MKRCDCASCKARDDAAFNAIVSRVFSQDDVSRIARDVIDTFGSARVFAFTTGETFGGEDDGA